MAALYEEIINEANNRIDLREQKKNNKQKYISNELIRRNVQLK